MLPTLLLACPALTFAVGLGDQPAEWPGGDWHPLLGGGAGLLLRVWRKPNAETSTGYRDDLDFLRRMPAVIAPDRPLFVAFDEFRLETFHLLFYGKRRATLLPKLSYLLDKDIHDAEVYVTCRCRDAAELSMYGTAEEVLVSTTRAGKAHRPNAGPCFGCISMRTCREDRSNSPGNQPSPAASFLTRCTS